MVTEKIRKINFSPFPDLTKRKALFFLLDPGSIPVFKSIQREFGVSQQKQKLSELPVVFHEGVVKSCIQKGASRAC
jgi:hypothetical protein